MDDGMCRKPRQSARGLICDRDGGSITLGLSQTTVCYGGIGETRAVSGVVENHQKGIPTASSNPSKRHRRAFQAVFWASGISNDPFLRVHPTKSLHWGHRHLPRPAIDVVEGSLSFASFITLVASAAAQPTSQESNCLFFTAQQSSCAV